MDITLFSPAQLEQYNKDSLLASVMRKLGLSESVALKLENLIPTKVIETQFSFTIVGENDDAILRGYALQSIKNFSDKAKADFVAENTPPIVIPFAPIDPIVDLPRATQAGWTWVEDATHWTFTKNTNIRVIPKNESLTNFNNNLEL